MNTHSSKSSQVRELLAKNMPPAAIAKKVGCSTNLVYVVKANTKAAKAGRGPRSGRRAAAPAGLSGLDGLLDAVRSGQRERAELRRALERIQAVLRDVLE